MPRKPSPVLTEAELRPMELLWGRGPSTVAEIVRALPPRLGLSYSTVLTTLRILEKKGYVTHRKAGQAFVYAPLVDRAQAQRRAVRNVLSRFFGGSAEGLLLNLVEHEAVSAEDLRRLQDLLAKNPPPPQP